MKILITLLSLLSIVFAQNPIIKVEGSDFLKALAYTENSPYVPMYDWDIGDSKTSPIVWDPNGNSWTSDGFERKGEVYFTNNGKITHTIVDTETKPGYWTLLLLGNKEKIIKATLTPNKVTLENPSINIDKEFIQEQVICEENPELKHTVYHIKFPQKLSFWMEENQTISTQGNKSTYVVMFDKKPECATKVATNKKINSNKISDSTKGQMKLFLEGFYKSGEDSLPSKTLSYYATSVDRYFSIKNATKEDILADKIRYYKKWTKRKYDIKDLEVLDSYIKDGVQYYIVNTAVDWNMISKNSKSVSDTSYNIITLIETDNGFLIKSIKSLDDSTKSAQDTSIATEDPKISLPFIGKARFNFDGGNGREGYIVIKENGDTEVGSCGTVSCSASYTGKFKEIMEGYTFTSTTVSMVWESGSIVRQCTEDGILMDQQYPCTQSLYFGYKTEPNTKKVNISQDVLDKYAYELLGGDYTTSGSGRTLWSTSNLAKKTNSKGVKIYCLTYKKVCKTEAEVIAYFNQLEK